MTKEYGTGMTKDYSAYSNINSYGNNGSPVSIIAPVTASFLPEIFYHMKPHPLPQWMIPRKYEPREDKLNSYSVTGGPPKNCD